MLANYSVNTEGRFQCFHHLVQKCLSGLDGGGEGEEGEK